MGQPTEEKSAPGRWQERGVLLEKTRRGTDNTMEYNEHYYAYNVTLNNTCIVMELYDTCS